MFVTYSNLIEAQKKFLKSFSTLKEIVRVTNMKDVQVQKFACAISLKHGTIIIGVLQSIFAFMVLVLSSAYAENPSELVDMSDPSIVPDLQVLKTLLIIIAIGAAVHCFFSIFLIFGAETNRPVLLLPWLFYNPLVTAFYVITTLIAIIYHSEQNYTRFISAHIFLSVITLCIASYKVIVVRSFYKHLKSLNF